MKTLSIFLATSSVLLLSASAFAGTACSTSDTNAEYPYLTVIGHGNGITMYSFDVTAGARTYTFLKSGSRFKLSADSSQSPGFSTVAFAGSSFSVFQDSDAGHGQWISYLCD